MSKSYKIIVKNGTQTAAQEVEVQSGQNQPVRIKAKADARYVLQDLAKQPVAAPDTVRASRKGKNLHLQLGESSVDDIIIEDYYSTFGPDQNAVTGLAEDGVSYEYIPQDPSAQNLLQQLVDGGDSADLVLGGDSVQTGAAVAVLAPFLSPGVLAAGAGAGAAAAGAGGGGGGGTTPVDPAATAVTDISKFAADNTTGLSGTVTGTVPDLAKYNAAGITGVTASNLAAINDALASNAVGASQTDTKTKIQAIVDAYNKVLAAADGNATDNTTGAAVPTATDYANIGVTGVSTASAKLLSDVIDNKVSADVDTVVEIQALADAAKAVASYTGSGTAPTQTELNAIAGGTAVSAQNLAAVQAAVAAANADGTPVSQAELNTLISGLNTAAADIGAFAEANTTGLAGTVAGTVPDLAKYTAAGVTGLGTSGSPNTALIAAVNDALASAPVDGNAANSPAELQAIVDSYSKILTATDGSATDNTTGAAVPTAADYASIGVTGTTTASAKLLSDVIDNKVSADVDTVAEIQALADAAKAVVDYTGAQGQTAPTAAQIQALAGGTLIITPQNLAIAQAAIAAANANTTGAGANASVTQAELQTIVAGLDTSAPVAPTLTLGTGVADGATAAEVAASAVTVVAEVGSTVLVTFTDSLGHSLVKTVTGNGTTPVAVSLSNTDIGSTAGHLSDGAISVSAVAIDPAGNASAAGTSSFILATRGPLLSATTLAGDVVSESNPTGEFNAVEYQALSATPLSLQGTTSATGRTVYAILNGRTYQATANIVSGVWQIDLPTGDATSLNHGSTYTTAVQVTDNSGNTTSANNYALRINTAAPDIPTVQTQWTNNAAPTLSGVARKLKPGATTGSTDLTDYMALEAGDTISVSVGGNAVNATVGSLPSGFSYNGTSGVWSFNAQTAGWTPLADNTYNVAISTQAGGVVKTDVSANELTINTLAPTVTLDPLAGDGIINAVESISALNVHGTTNAGAGSAVSITVGGITYTTQVLYSANGNYIDFNIPAGDVQMLAATQGSKAIVIDVTNEYGTHQNLSPILTVDTLAPATPELAPAGYGDDVGSVQSTNSTANTTDDRTPGINVGVGLTTSPSLYVNGVKVTAVYNSVTGALTPVNALTDGAKAFTYTLTDAAGNESGQSPALNVTINTATPAIGSATASWGSVLNAAESGVDQSITVSTTGVENGQSVTVTLDGHIYTGQVSNDSAIVTVPVADLAALTDGQTYNYSISVSNSAGTSAVASNNSFSVQKAPPATPVLSGITVTADNVVNHDEAAGTITITGTVSNASTSDTISVSLGGNTYSGTINANGSFSVNVPGSLLAAATSVSVSVTATDANGNTSTGTTTKVYSVDTLVPAVPTGVSVLDTDGDNLPTVSGVAEPGSTVTITTPAGQTYTTQADAATGAFSLELPTTPSPLTGNYSVTARDAAGNTSAAATVTASDLTAPSAPAFSVADTNGNGLPNISGTAEALSTVKITVPGGQSYQVNVDANGRFSLELASAPNPLLGTYSATASDAAGNTSAATTVTPTDLTAPSAPVLTLGSGVAGGATAAEAQAGAINVTAETGSTIVASFTDAAGHTVTKTLSNATGSTQSVALAASDLGSGANQLSDGPISVSVKVTDAAGNTSQASAASFILDTTPPEAPVTSDITVAGDNIVSVLESASNTLSVTGTVTGAKTGDTVTLTVNGNSYAGSVSDSTFNITGISGSDLAAVGDGNTGSVSISITTSDSAGNSATGTSTVSYQALLTPPNGPTAIVIRDSDGNGLPNISGVAPANSSVNITAPSGQTYTTTADSQGNFSTELSPAPTTLTGNYSFTSSDGTNTSAPVVVNASDLTAPTVPNNLRVVDTDGDGLPTVSGSAEPGSTVRITDPAGMVHAVVADAVTGSFSLELSSAPSPLLGSYSFTATDTAGNTSQAGSFNATDLTSPTIGNITPSWGSNLNIAESGVDQTLSIATFGAQNGQTVTVTLNGQTYTGQVINGNATVAVPTADLAALADGQNYTLAASVTDAAGNTSAQATATTSVDKTPPATPVVSGVKVTADDVVNHNEAAGSITITGSVANATTSDSVTVSVGGNTYSGTIAANGSFSVNVPGSVLAGVSSLSVSATATDTNGNTATSAPVSKSYSVDTAVPAAPTLSVKDTDGNGNPTFSGVAEPGSTVTITDPSGATHTVQADATTGAYSLEISAPNPLTGNYSASATDAALNTSVITTVNASDLTAPDTPGNLRVADTDGDGIPTVSGTAEANSTITITAPSGQTYTTQTNAQGQFSYELPNVPSTLLGNYSFTATDAAGNTSTASSFTASDLSAPVQPTLAYGAGVGASNGATAAEAQAGAITAIAEAGSTLAAIFTDAAGHQVVKTLTNASGSAQAIALAPSDLGSGANQLADGVISVSVTATDAAGNTSLARTTSFTLDTLPPATPVIDLGAGVSDGATAQEASAGTGVISITAENGATTVVTFSNGANTVTKTLTASGSAQAITLSAADLSALGDGTISVSVTATDAAGNPSTVTSSFNLIAGMTPIADYAETGATAPVLQNYLDAGVTGVSSANLAAINNAINAQAGQDGIVGNTDDRGAADTLVKVQAIVDAYNKILTAADGSATDNTSGAAVPTAADYASIGVTGTTTASAKLLSDVIDNKVSADVDTVAEIQALADAAKAVASYTGSGTAPTAAQLNAIMGGTAVMADNLAAVQAAVAAANADGTPVTQAELQDIATTVNNAFEKIGDYAANSTANPAPTAADYLAAGVTGVSGAIGANGNVDAINSAINAQGGPDGMPGNADDRAAVVNTAQIQAIVDAYNKILAEANDLDANAGNSVADATPAANPLASDYAAIGANIGAAATDADNLALLNDIIGASQAADVDTIGEIDHLARIANAIQTLAAGGTPTPALTPADFAVGGIAGVNSDNLAAVQAAIAAKADSGVETDSLSKIQALVTVANNALAKIEAYNNGDGSTPVALTAQDYADAGITGVTSDNLAAVNAQVLAQATGGADTAPEVQALVAAANNALAKIEAYNNGDGTSPVALTLQDYADAGITGVTADNLAAVNAKVLAQSTGGADTAPEVQALVNTAATAAAAALSAISAAAQANNADGTTHATLGQYADLGIEGVDASNLAAINSALNDTAVQSAQTDTTAKVQAIVDAYKAILAEANDSNANPGNSDADATPGSNPTAAQYATIGANIGAAATDAENLALLNDIVGASQTTDVDTVAEIENLARIANAIQTVAAGGTASPALTAADFAKIGVSGVTADNLAAVTAGIAAKADDGSATDSLAELQAIVSGINTAAANIGAFAQAETTGLANAITTAPSTSDYTAAGVTGVNGTNVAAINDALASNAVNGAAADTPAKLQAIVNAYNAILAEANGATADADPQDPTAAQYATIGVIGVDAGAEESLLGDVIGNKVAAEVNTVAKVQTLADAVQAVMDVAALDSTTTVPAAYQANNAVFTQFATQLQALGLTGVNADNAGAIWAAVRDTVNSGVDVNNLLALQNIIDAANDRPVLARSAFTLNATEDTVLSMQVSSLLTSSNVTDGDTGTVFSGIAIHWNQSSSAQGVWQWSANGITGWTTLPADLSTNSPGNSFWLNASDYLRFVPTDNYNGSANSTADGKTFPLLFRIGDSTMPVTASGTRLNSPDLNKSGQSLTDASIAMYLQVAAVNDAPVLATGSTLGYTENDAATAINPNITVADVDNNTLASASVSITTGFVSGQDVLSFTNNASTMGNVAASYNSGTGVMSLTSAGSTATLAQWQAALRAVSYSNTSDNPSTSARTVSYTVNDGAANAVAVTSTVNVTAVNDVPVMGASTSATTLEDTAYSFVVGTQLGSMVIDPDGTAIKGIVIGQTSTNGTWAYSTDGVNWTNFSVPAITWSQALYLQATDHLRFTPGQNVNGTDSTGLLFRGVDVSNTTFLRGNTYDVGSLTGATGSVSGAGRLNFNVTAVNDAPTLSVTTSTPTFTEGGTSSQSIQGSSVSLFSAASTATGPSNESGQTLTHFTATVSGLVDGANEVLIINGTSVSLTQGTSGTNGNGTSYSVSVTGSTATVTITPATGSQPSVFDTIIDNLRYINTSIDTPTAGQRVITLTGLSDNGGTANGGADTSVSANTLTIDVTAVNDAPVNTVPGAQTTAEDTPLAITGLQISDVDAGSSTMTLTLAVTNGTLNFVSATGTGVTLSVSGVAGAFNYKLSGTLSNINSYLATANAVTYVPTANYNGSATLTMTTSDGGNTGTGGTLTDVDTVAITVTSVNDAPTGTSSTLTLLEDGSKTFAAADFGFADAADSSPNALSAVIITTLPTAGTLKLNGIAVTAGQSIALADLGNLVFAPVANANGNGYATIGFKVQDNGGTANSGVDTSVSANTLTFNVTAVSDAPVVSGGVVSNLSSNTPYILTTAFTFNYSDADGDPQAGVIFTELPAASVGIIKVNGVAVTTGTLVTIADINAGHVILTAATNYVGDVIFKFKAVDTSASNNESTPVTATFSFIEDNPPTLVSTSPADNGSLAAANVANNLTMTFSEAVQKGTGVIQLFKSDGTSVESFDVASSTLVTGWGTSTLTINPTANLVAGTNYYVRVATTAVKDLGGNAYAGITDSTTFNFSVLNTDGSASIDPVSGPSGGALGFSVSSAGDVNGDGFDDMIVGAPYTGGMSINSAGAAYVIYGNAAGALPNLSSGSIAASDGFKISGYSDIGLGGGAVSNAGDINGDGYSDVIVSGSVGNTPMAFVIYGKAVGSSINLASGSIAASDGFKITGATTSKFGSSVSSAGDVNGDGLDDLIIGAQGTTTAYVVYGKTGGMALNLTGASLAASDGFALTGPTASYLGYSVSAAGDVNGDGFADIIVGAQNQGISTNGAVYVVYGSATGANLSLTSGTIASSFGFVITGGASSYLGQSVSSAGDVNGDGYADIVVGAIGEGSSAGRVYVVFGGATNSSFTVNGTLNASQGFTISGVSSGSNLGQSVASAGDVNGDGLGDLIVGGNGGKGVAYVVFGSTTGASINLTGDTIAASNGFKIVYGGTATTSGLGKSVSSAGDINGDGLDDLIVGEYLVGSVSGAYSVILGGTQTITNAINLTGTAADEAVLGTAGNDTLTGGGGTDRFYAGKGDDTIVLTASDLTALSATIGSVRALVDGGTGYDTIRLSGGASMNLSSISNAGSMGLEENSRIESIERIDMATDTAANTLTIEAKDVKDMAGFNSIHTGTASADGKTWTNINAGTALSAITKFHQVVVDGTSADSLNLGVGFSLAGTVSNGTSTYSVYQSTATSSQVIVNSAITNVVLDLPPTLLSSSPSDNGFMMAVGNNITLNFSEMVVKGTGVIELYTAAGTLVQSFDVASSALVTGWGTANLTINPTSDLTVNTGYYIKIGSMAVKDQTSNYYAGIADAITLNFTTANADGSLAVPTGFSGSTDSMLGWSVSKLGDVNGDGFEDVIIGAPGMNAVASAAYVVYGNAAGEGVDLASGTIAASRGFKISGFSNDQTGFTVSSAGDINGDGFADVLVGGYARDMGGSNAAEGAAYVVYGSATGGNVNLASLQASQGFAIVGPLSETFGYSVSNAGDVNGDGLNDLIFGATGPTLGAAYVIYGNTNGMPFNFFTNTALDASQGFRVAGTSSTTTGPVGYAVSSAGDFNGDGFADVIVSAPDVSDAFILFGGTTGYQTGGDVLSLVAAGKAFRIDGATTDDKLGRYVTSVGDINGDGFSDVAMVGAAGNGNSAVRVIYGSRNPTGTVNVADIASNAALGFSVTANNTTLTRVSGAGDINGDGLADMLIAGSSSSTYVGWTYVVYGSSNATTFNVNGGTIASSLGFLIKNDSMGQGLSSAGDFNGDGLDDLVLGLGRTLSGDGRYSIVLGGTQWLTLAIKGSGTVTGTAGDELLVGSAGNDTLTGGGGVDRFAGGIGNDTVVLTSSDVSNLASNVLSGVKATVDGGTGFDSICLVGGANLDLTTISNVGAMGLEEGSRIENIERIDLATDTAANILTIAAKDVNDMAGFNTIHTGSVSADGKTWSNVSGAALSVITKFHQLVVDGGGNDGVTLAAGIGDWGNVGVVSDGSNNYSVFQNTATYSQVLVKSGMAVTNNDAAAFAAGNTVTVSGVTMTLSDQWVQNGKTYYRVSNFSGTGDSNNNTIYTTHNLIDTMFNGGSDTTDTLANRSFSANGYTFILPTKDELVALSNTPPAAYFNGRYWSSTLTTAGSHYSVGIYGDWVYDVADTSPDYLIVQVSPVVSSIAPMVLDLNGDGTFSYTHTLIDVNGDGHLDYTAWAAQQDGVLVWNKFGDGVVHDASQYAFTQYGGETDLAGLAAGFDSNHDGVLDAQDAKFAEFAVWQDTNGNGVSDAGEVRSLADWGITSIYLTSDGTQRTPAAGVTEAGHTSATLADGSSMAVADAAFLYQAGAVQGRQGAFTFTGTGMSIDLDKLQAAVGNVDTLDLGTGNNTLSLNLAELLQPTTCAAHPLTITGVAGDAVELFTQGEVVNSTATMVGGQTYQGFDLNHDGQLDLLVQQAVMLNMH